MRGRARGRPPGLSSGTGAQHGPAGLRCSCSSHTAQIGRRPTLSLPPPGRSASRTTRRPRSAISCTWRSQSRATPPRSSPLPGSRVPRKCFGSLIQFGTSSHATLDPGRPLVCQVLARPHRLLPRHKPLTPRRAGRQGLLRGRVRQGRVRHLRAGACPAPSASPCALPVEARARKGSPRADGGTDFGRRCRVRSSR